MAEDFYQLGYGSNPMTPRAIETTATDFSGVENLTDMYQKNLAAKKAKAGEVQESVFTATEGAYVNPELEAVRSSKANKIKSIYDSWDGSEEGLMQIKSELSGLESFKGYADLAEKKYIEGLYEDPTTIRKSPTMQAQIKGEIPEELTAFMSELDWNNPDDREKIKSMVGRSIMTNAKLRPEDALASMARDMKYGKTTITTIENGKEVKREIPTTTEEQRKALGAKFDAAIATLEPEEAAQYDREEFISNYLPKQKTEKKPYEEKEKEEKNKISDADLSKARDVKERVNDFQDTRNPEPLNKYLSTYGYYVEPSSDNDEEYTIFSVSTRTPVTNKLRYDDAESMYNFLDKRAKVVSRNAIDAVEFEDPTPVDKNELKKVKSSLDKIFNPETAPSEMTIDGTVYDITDQAQAKDAYMVLQNMLLNNKTSIKEIESGNVNSNNKSGNDSNEIEKLDLGVEIDTEKLVKGKKYDIDGTIHIWDGEGLVEQ